MLAQAQHVFVRFQQLFVQMFGAGRSQAANGHTAGASELSTANSTGGSLGPRISFLLAKGGV